MNSLSRTLLAAGVLGVSVSASGQIVGIGAGDFTPDASVITFSEVPLGTQNPVYDVDTASLGNVTVSFGPRFVGQSLSKGFPVSLTGIPSAPLSLDLSSGRTFTVNDGANPNSPVLSGSPTFNGPISVLFSTPVAAVGLDGGYFDAINSTAITAFDSTGAVLGTITNFELGIEFFGLATASGANRISGISFCIIGDEPAGFAIDNLTFGSSSELVHSASAVPEPSTCGAIAVATFAFSVLRRRPKR